jgi:alkylation response protein AidB-like acyl-CoA dehydrogenase
MNFELSGDQLTFQTLAKTFSDNELKPNAAKWDAECSFPLETIKKAGELGFCSLYVSEDNGGMGLSKVDATIIIEELAAGCTSTTAFMTIHNMATWMVSEFGSTKLKEEWLQGLNSGSKLSSYCLTEPGSGSDAASLKTSAVKKDNCYVLNGNKA